MRRRVRTAARIRAGDSGTRRATAERRGFASPAGPDSNDGGVHAEHCI